MKLTISEDARKNLEEQIKEQDKNNIRILMQGYG